MPSIAGQHPSQAVLRAYLQGRLPAADAAKLDYHIETCETCGKMLAAVDSDTYCDLLRQSSTLFDGQRPDPPTELPAELHNHPRDEIGERLGGGGMGVVYRAVHRMMHRQVALKLIRPDLLAAPAAVERFRREVQAAARLAHPNIVTAYDAEEVAGLHFLVMEFVEGKTLEQVVRKRGPLPAAIACHLIRQAALGLEHAHAHGMVHRDIKPQNLIVTTKSKVKILDFGLALWSGPRPSDLPKNKAETSAIGTLLYAAPEQLRPRGEVDARADQYGLGATLYYLLTGRPPRSLDDNVDSIEPFLLDFPDGVPEGVRKIAVKLLSDDPEDRYPSAKAVAEVLAPWCSSQPVDQSNQIRRIAMYAVSGLLALLVGFSGYALIKGGREFPIEQTTQKDGRNTILPPPPKVTEASKTGEWRSLLSGLDPSKNKVMGYWRMVNGELWIDAALGARILLPARPTGEYDLRFSFTRRTGIHSIGAIVVQGGRPVCFEVDAWEQHLAGLQDINGASMITNPTRRENYELENGKRYTILIEVRHNGITGYLDGRLVTSHRTDGRDLSVNNRYWAMPDEKALGLLAWNSTTVFHAVEIRELEK